MQVASNKSPPESREIESRAQGSNLHQFRPTTAITPERRQHTVDKSGLKAEIAPIDGCMLLADDGFELPQ